MQKTNLLITGTLFFGIISLFLEQSDITSPLISIIINVIDIIIAILLITEIVTDYRLSPYKKIYFKSNLFSLCFALFYLGLFFYTKLSLPGFGFGSITGAGPPVITAGYAPIVIIIRNIFMILKVFSRFRRLAGFIENITIHPAQTIFFSFLVVIIVGTFLLMLPFSTTRESGLPFIDSLFTATSAVCVTGLIVVDTATAFTLWGKMIILALIQIGGLGIMILSYFTIFALHRAVSIEDKLLISYMLSEDDMRNLAASLRSIIYITFAVEAAGALLLYFGFSVSGIAETAGAAGVSSGWGSLATFTIGDFFRTVFFAVFHSVSAFCNAGFALFSDSLEQYKSSLFLNAVVSGLIITGGLSFIVISNIRNSIADRIKRLITHKRFHMRTLSLNTRIVLLSTAILIFTGLLIIYAIEHGKLFAPMGLGRQYLASFFQSATLRTAGFNTVPIGSLTTTTLFVFILFMFIGAASGSTAGGIKVNTVAVMGAYIISILRQRNTVTIANHSIDISVVLKSFVILLFGLSVVAAGTLVLLMSEGAALTETMFEAVSAFATVGLSTGLTTELSFTGKATIICLMFFGRLGPLTVLAALAPREKQLKISYPKAEISIG